MQSGWQLLWQDGRCLSGNASGLTALSVWLAAYLRPGCCRRGVYCLGQSPGLGVPFRPARNSVQAGRRT